MKKRNHRRAPSTTTTRPLTADAMANVSGGGSTAKEAYFVRCDRSTITQ